MRTKHLLHPLVIALCIGALCLGSSVSAQDVAGDLLGRINALRASLGLPGYRLNGALSAAAQSHAQWMAETGQVSHTQPNGSTPSTRAAAAGYPSAWVSENIYAGSNASTDAAWGFWINSPIHYRGLTNASYDEIGIGSAATSWGRAYVLVFGASGAPSVARSGGGGGGGGGNAAAAPPSFVVGVDASGNIMHEIQDGHTPGDIALIYGYTWDDIPAMLALNGLTEADQRSLKVGSIFLVPPQAGTYTPTPGGPTVTPGVAPADLTAIAQAVANTTALPPAPSATPEATRLRPRAMTRTAEAAQAQGTPTGDPVALVVLPRISTAAAVPVEMASPTVSLTPDAQMTPSPEATPSPTSDGAPSATPTVAPTEVALVAPPPANGPAEVIIIREGTSPWLIGALVLQAVVIAFAAFEFARRARR